MLIKKENEDRWQDCEELVICFLQKLSEGLQERTVYTCHRKKSYERGTLEHLWIGDLCHVMAIISCPMFSRMPHNYYSSATESCIYYSGFGTSIWQWSYYYAIIYYNSTCQKSISLIFYLCLIFNLSAKLTQNIWLHFKEAWHCTAEYTALFFSQIKLEH